MRAKFVNEKFKEDTDPIKDMGIGVIVLLNIDFFKKDMKEVQRLSPGQVKSVLLKFHRYANNNMTFIGENKTYTYEKLLGRLVSYENKIYKIEEYESDKN